MGKVLVTGGAGFIGFHLSSSLADKENNVTIVDNLFRGKKDKEFMSLMSRKNVKYIEGDLTNPETFKSLDKDYDEVYHLAAINGTKHFYESPHIVLRTNILSTLNVLDWFSTTQSKKILFSSSCETYAGTMNRFGLPIPTPEDVPLSIEDIKNPRWSYGGSKILGELMFINYAKTHRFKMSIVRYHNIYGPRMGHEHVIPEFLYRVYNKEEPFLIRGNDKRAFCYIDDAVKATELVMKTEACNDKIINIGNDLELIPMEELAKTIFKVLNHNSRIEIQDSPAGSVSKRCPDISKLMALTGYKPEIMLQEGIMRTHHYYYNKHKEGASNE